MNRLERFVHARVADYPQLRIPIVAAYQHLLSILPRNNYLSDHAMRVGAGMFFGFHDKCPWSNDGSMLLAHKFDAALGWEEVENAPVAVGFLEHKTFAFHPLATTRAWNWQQGAMLQWVGPSDLILFNDHRDGQDICRLMSTSGEPVAEIPCHVSSVSPDGKRALGYCFARMRYAAPEYSYRIGSHAEEHTPLPRDDGLSTVDLSSGTQYRLFSLEDVANIRPDDSMLGAYHYFSHSLFSPTGNRFAFFHRWIGRNRVLHTRLFSCSQEGGAVHLFPVTHGSHICWRDEEWILCYCKPVGREPGYYLLHDRHDDMEAIAASALDSDGHPQFSRDGRYLVTDTYPNRSRMQALLVYDMVTRRKQTLAALRIGFAYRYARRCDFHPRWSHDSGHLCFDSAHTGTRSLCVMDVPEYATHSYPVDSRCT